MNRKRWTSPEDDLLRGLPASGMTQARAAEILGRSIAAVSRRVAALGIQCKDWKPPPAHPWRRPLTIKGHAVEAARRKA